MTFNNNKLYYSAILLQFILGCFLYISKNCITCNDKYFTEKKDWDTESSDTRFGVDIEKDSINKADIVISSFRCRDATEQFTTAFNPIELDTIRKDGVEIKINQ